jgi:hypothetical protein
MYKHHYCSRGCYTIDRASPKLAERICICEKKYKPNRASQTACSRSCATKLSRKSWSTVGKDAPRNSSERNLMKLQHEFGIKTCMVEGCTYDRALSIHRLFPGKLGGKYEVGNMFSICPNHHTEAHTGWIKLEKITDCSLRIKEG